LLQMQKNGSLDESVVLGFAKDNHYEELVVALGLLCSTSLSVIEPLMRGPRHDGVLIACRAANLGWPTVQLILKNRFAHQSIQSIAKCDLQQAKSDYCKLSLATAQRLLRFWQVRTSVWEQEQTKEKRASTRRLTLTAGIVEISGTDLSVDCVVLDLAKT